MDIEKIRADYMKMDDKQLKVQQLMLLIEIMNALNGISNEIRSAVAHKPLTM